MMGFRAPCYDDFFEMRNNWKYQPKFAENPLTSPIILLYRDATIYPYVDSVESAQLG